MAKLNWNPAPPGMRWNKLKSLRKERNLSQPEVAVGAGISVATVYFLEMGYEERTTEGTKKKLAEFFNCDVDDLFPVEMIGNEPRENIIQKFTKKLGKHSARQS